MGVKLNTRQIGDVVLVDVSGRITLNEGSSALREEIRALRDKGTKKVVLNFGEVTYVDSAGLGELISGYTSMARAGGTLKLLRPTKRIKDLLQITHTYTLFDVHDDEAQAVRSFT